MFNISLLSVCLFKCTVYMNIDIAHYVTFICFLYVAENLNKLKKKKYPIHILKVWCSLSETH